MVEYFVNHFLVVEMVLYAMYLLVVLVSLACHNNNIALLCKGACSPDSLLAVNNRYGLFLLLLALTGKHVIDDILRILVSWIVRCEYHSAAGLCCLGCHQRTLALVAVAAGTQNGDDVATAT